MHRYRPMFSSNDKIYPVTGKIMPTLYESKKVSFEQETAEIERFKRCGYRYMAVSGVMDGWILDPRV